MEIDNISSISTTASLSQVEPTEITSTSEQTTTEQTVQDEFIGNYIDILS